MKKLCLLAGLLMATQVFAAPVSTVTFTLTPDNPDLSMWTFIIGIDTEATDDFDLGTDANEPPWPPAGEVRMHTLGVPGSSSGLMMDIRDGALPIDIGGYWTPAGDSVRAEVWGLGGVDPQFPDLCAIDGNNLGTTGYTTGILTWDLSQAGDYTYFLFDLDSGTEMILTPGGQYDWMVMNRFGMGPTLVLSCLGSGEIPEPGTMLLLGTGLLGLVAAVRRSR